jgi:hypothetical protein
MITPIVLAIEVLRRQTRASFPGDRPFRGSRSLRALDADVISSGLAAAAGGRV